MSKRFTAKQRAAIYLEAARIEQKDYQGGIDYLLDKAGTWWDFKISYPEIILFNKEKVLGVFDEPEIQDMRILALLFAHQMALNP